MSDYTDMTDEQLDALAAERMGKVQDLRRAWGQALDIEPPGQSFLPTTNAKHRDEWVVWLLEQGLRVYFLHEPHAEVTVLVIGTGLHEIERGDRAAVVAGLRATDE